MILCKTTELFAQSHVWYYAQPNPEIGVDIGNQNDNSEGFWHPWIIVKESN